MKRLCLVDVSAMYFRAFYAIRPLTNSKGLPTNALFGFLSMTGKMLRELKPDYIAYCFDRKDGSFRSDMYEDYKANRSEMPEELVPQVPYVKKLTEALNIKALEKEGFEADDVIGMMASLSTCENTEVMIVSGDKDFAQLVNKNVKMFDPMKEKLYDIDGVVEKWGVRPDQIIDYLSLVGDASDNVPGVKGIGPKGAVKLLTEFETLEGIYENIDKISAKGTKKKLEENKENAFLSKDLVTIITENKTDIEHVDELLWEGFEPKVLEEVLQELEFKNMGKRLLKDSAYKMSGVEEVETEEADDSSLNFDAKELEAIAVHEMSDTESLIAKLNPKDDVYFYLMGENVYFGQEQNIFSLAAESLEKDSDKIPALNYRGHDLKSLWRSFRITSGLATRDSMIAEYLILSKSIESFDSLVDSYFSKKTLSDPKEYFVALKKIEEIHESKLKEINCWEDYLNIELPTLKVLSQMEEKGVCLDTDILSEQAEKLNKELEELRAEVFSITEQEFNLDSPKQLGKVLFDDMKLPVVKKTKTGYSTNSDVLNKLSVKHPWTKKIVQYREIKKLLSTYVESLPKLVSPDTKRLHTHFNQAVTATGRLSSTEPNLQNIPIRTPQGNEVRAAFVAPEDYVLLSADYSQIELRLLAHITKDPGLQKAFKEDKDIHTATASEVFEVAFDQVDSEMRRRAKAVNFGIAYGMGAFSLADNLGINRKEAKDIIDRYFKRFGNVKEYMSEIVESAKEKGYVESIFGRRRYIPELSSSNAIVRKNGERIAINSPMQASASDIVKKAMVDLGAQLDNASMLLQVHDELIFEVPKTEVESLQDKVKTAMEKVVDLDVPLKVNASFGKNWKEAH